MKEPLEDEGPIDGALVGSSEAQMTEPRNDERAQMMVPKVRSDEVQMTEPSS